MADLPGYPTGDGAAFVAQPGTGLQTGGIYTYNAADPLFGYAPTVQYWGQAAPSGGGLSSQATSTSTGVNPNETSYSLYGHSIPLSVFGVGRIGGEIIAGPWVDSGLASFIISFGVPADPSGTRDIREIAFDSEVVWTTNGATGITTLAGGTFTVEAFTARFYQGTLAQAADTLETTHFGANANAYRPQILLAFSNLPLAGTKFNKIPYVAAVIGDGSGDDVNFGEAFRRLAYSPWVGWTSAQFDTSGITDGVTSGGMIIAQESQFLQLIQQFGRFYPKWDILQTDKLRISDRGDDTSFDIELDKTTLTGAVTLARAEPNSVPKVLELSTIDPGADYTIVPSRAQTPLAPVAVSTSVKTEKAYLPVIMDAATRASIVTYTKYHEEIIRKKISFSAMAFGLEIEPGDFVAITGMGDDFTDEVFRVIETLHGTNYVVEITAEAILRCDLGSSGGDPHISLVVLLLSGNGTNGSTTFTDESPKLHGNATVNSTAAVSTAQKVFGTGSILGPRLSYANSVDWDFQAGYFTLEGRIRPTDVTTNQYLLAWWMGVVGFPFQSWIVSIQSGHLKWTVSTDGFNALNDMTSSTTLVVNTWYAWAIDFDGAKYRMYLDGVMVASFLTPRTIYGTVPSIGERLGINDSGDGGFPYSGYQDEIRITKGLARYASDSGYTVATAAFPRT